MAEPLREARIGAPRPEGGRVLLVGVSAQRYGSDRSLLAIADGLVAAGWAVEVMVPEDGPLVGDLRAVGAQVHVAPVGIFRRAFTPVHWMRYLVSDLPAAVRATRARAARCDVAHVNAAPLLGAALGVLLARRPLVWHIRESFAGAPRLWRAYGRLIARAAAVVVANSASTARLAGLTPAVDAVVVPNALTRGSGGGELGPPRHRSPAPDGTVVTVGRINVWKGQDVLVRSVAMLRDRGIGVRLEIAGDPFPGSEHHLENLERLIRDLGLSDAVGLLGFVEDVPELLARSQIFVLPSKEPEPFGLALLEAMAAGLPCIATAAGGPTEIVRDGETGLLVPPDDPAGLAAAIELLLGDAALRARLGNAARAEVVRRFSPAAMTSALEEVYEAVLAADRSSRTGRRRARPAAGSLARVGES